MPWTNLRRKLQGSGWLGSAPHQQNRAGASWADTPAHICIGTCPQGRPPHMGTALEEARGWARECSVPRPHPVCSPRSGSGQMSAPQPAPTVPVLMGAKPATPWENPLLADSVSSWPLTAQPLPSSYPIWLQKATGQIKVTHPRAAGTVPGTWEVLR